MRIKISFAQTRERFVSNIEDILAGALQEFYKAELGQMGYASDQDVIQWRREVESIFQRFENVLLRKTKGTFNKLVALHEVFEFVESIDETKRRYVLRVWQNSYKHVGELPPELTYKSDVFKSLFAKFKSKTYAFAEDVLNRGKKQ